MKIKIKSIGNLVIIFIVVGLFSQSDLNYVQTRVSFNLQSSSIYYIPHTNIRITDDDNFTTTYGFPGSGIEQDPFLITNYNLTRISIRGTTKHFKIKNNYVGGGGIEVKNVTVGTANIIENICSSGLYGIIIDSAPQTIITNNTCSFHRVSGWYLQQDYQDGIGIAVYNSPNSTISKNLCYENGEFGIEIHSSNYSLIEANLCRNNGYLQKSDFIFRAFIHAGLEVINTTGVMINSNLIGNNIGPSIRLEEVDDLEIFNNTCYYNIGHGIEIRESSRIAVLNNSFCDSYDGAYVEESSSCLFVFNLFQNNTRYAASLLNTHNSIFHHNSFAYTQLHGRYYFGYERESSEAFDDGNTNYWYNDSSKEGNWWSNRKGDSPYEIDGPTEVYDLYPLDESPVPLTMKKPINIQLIVGVILPVTLLGFLGVIYIIRKLRQSQEL